MQVIYVVNMNKKKDSANVVVCTIIFTKDYLVYLPDLLKWYKEELKKNKSIVYDKIFIFIGRELSDNISLITSIAKIISSSGVNGFIVDTLIREEVDYSQIAKMRNSMFEYVKQMIPESTHIFSVDIDTIPTSNKTIRTLLRYLESDVKAGIISGKYLYKEGSGSKIVARFYSREFDSAVRYSRKKVTEVMGVGFGLTLLKREITDKYRCPETMEEAKPYETEDFPVCDMIRKDGYKVLWSSGVVASHMRYNKDKNAMDVWI